MRECTDVERRVAEAIWLDRFPNIAFESASELDRNDFIGHACAALEAIRLPTEDMIHNAMYLNLADDMDCARIYTAMINAASPNPLGTEANG
jgi:hypothetical protein